MPRIGGSITQPSFLAASIADLESRYVGASVQGDNAEISPTGELYAFDPTSLAARDGVNVLYTRSTNPMFGGNPSEPGRWILIPSGGGGGGEHTQLFVVTFDGETSFTVSSPITDPSNVQLFVNGQLATNVLDYTIAGQTLTWLNVGFILTVGDEIIVHYQ